MKLSDIVMPPDDRWPINVSNNYSLLDAKTASAVVPKETKKVRVSGKDLVRLYSIRAKKNQIDGVAEFLETLNDVDQETLLFGLSFDFSDGHVIVIIDENDRYVAHIIKRQ